MMADKDLQICYLVPGCFDSYEQPVFWRLDWLGNHTVCGPRPSSDA
jgi:hypothetical protein